MTEHAVGLTSFRLDQEGFRKAILGKLIYQVGKDPQHATRHDWFFALALAVRDRLVDGWMTTTRTVYDADRKRVYYLSLEFLIGRLLVDSLRNLGLYETASGALDALGVDAQEVFTVEPDAALGNGGLGRLAACLLDSMATLGIAAFGYGIRYEHGLFKQGLDDGWQVERPEDWLAFGNPWEFERSEAVYPVRLYGHVRDERDAAGKRTHVWEGGQRVLAVAYDTPVVGWGGRHVNTLRLWSAQSGNLIDLEAFNRGDYMRAVQDQTLSQSISRVLYPNDATEAGQELRLKQEYFFTSASLQDIIRRHLSYHPDLRSLPDKAAIQLNDTHPAIAVPELMRLLIDEHGVDWETAWTITRGTIHYTNHTLMPEALERWSVQLMERLLPRQLQLIYEINAYVLTELRTRPDLADPFLSRGLDHRRGLQPRGADGQPRLPRLAPGQRRLGPARRADEADGVPAAAPAVPRPDHRDHQRRHAAPLGARRQPRAREPDQRHAGHDALDHRSRAARGAGPARHGSRVPGALRRDQAGEQGAAGELRRQAPRHRAADRRALRRAHQAHPRVQAAAAQHPGGGGDLRRHAGPARPGFRAAGEDLRRQGGAVLHPGQADHQVHQRRRRRGEPRRPRCASG